jgi:hypothetical protein
MSADSFPVHCALLVHLHHIVLPLKGVDQKTNVAEFFAQTPRGSSRKCTLTRASTSSTPEGELATFGIVLDDSLTMVFDMKHREALQNTRRRKLQGASDRKNRIV